jgi:hypothetical protein
MAVAGYNSGGARDGAVAENTKTTPDVVASERRKIGALRYRGLLPNGGMEGALNSRSATSSESDTVAVYSDSAQTIYLPQGWTGSTAAELSILVHEMVHHVQHLAGLKYECPQAREQLAWRRIDGSICSAVALRRTLTLMASHCW